MLTKLKMMRDSAKCLLVVIAVMLLAALGAVVMASEPEPGPGPVGVVPGEGGSTMELHSAAGGCSGGARLAIWFSVDRKERVPGCWKPIGNGTLQIAFSDGDVARIPMAAVQKPSSL